MAPPEKKGLPSGEEEIDNLFFKKQKKWERQKRALKRIEASSTAPGSRVKNGAAIKTRARKMRKLEADMKFLQDEKHSLLGKSKDGTIQ
nr:hypothetical protein [Candidatus Sigynarchaeota archaeon]